MQRDAKAVEDGFRGPRTSDLEAVIRKRYSDWLSVSQCVTRLGYDPHELVQEAICSTLEQMRKGACIHDLDRYICRSIRRKFIDLIRHYKRFSPCADPPAHMQDTNNPEESCYTKCVFERLSRLPPHQRKILEEAAKGSSYQEMSLALGIPLGTVMSRLNRARAALRASLGD